MTGLLIVFFVVARLIDSLGQGNKDGWGGIYFIKRKEKHRKILLQYYNINIKQAKENKDV
jgi:hypothetical protein